MTSQTARPIAVLAAIATAALILTACTGNPYGRTEYRAAPVKSAAEIRQDEIGALRRSRNTPGGAGEDHGTM